MGTHPIFESDFDCLTDMIRTGKLLQRQSVLQLVRPKLEQKNEVADITEAIEGREDRKLFAPEYISPERQAPHSLWKRLVRQDCLRRRNVIEIPEFYVGSLLRVTYTDKYAQDKSTIFAGRVIYLHGFGTNHKVLLRNFVNGTMVNLKIDLYSPIIQKIEVLRLEKWKDSNLQYLKLCDPAYCTVPLDMMPEPPTPLNKPLKYFEGKVMFKRPTQMPEPPVTEQERVDDPIGTEGKHFNGHWQNIHYGDKRISLKQNQKWPQYQNLFADEFTIKEDDIYAQYLHRLANWAKYDIMRHHNFVDEKESVIKEMSRNKKILPQKTRAIGRPKVDYSKISKVWIEDYNLKTCEPTK